MQLVIGDANLCTKTILKAICKAGAGIDHHAGTIHFTQKTVCSDRIGCDDGIGMLTALALNVVHRIIQRAYGFNRQNRGKVFGLPVLFCCVYQFIKTGHL